MALAIPSVGHYVYAMTAISDSTSSPPLPAGSLPTASIDDIRYLIVFAKVAEAGSFSRAAGALGLSTATASQHVTRLETRLGTALLYRNTRKLSLTADGERLLETARAMLVLYEQALPEFPKQASRSQMLRVAMPAILHRSPLMTALAGFMAMRCDVKLHLHSSENRNDLVGESIDVAFRAGALADSGLRSRLVFAIDRITVAAPGLLRSHASLTHPLELANLPWIGLSMRPNERRYVHRSGAAEQFSYTPRIIVDSVEAAYELCKRGLGIAAPPRFLVAEDSQAVEMVHVLPEWALDPLPVHAVWPPNLSRHSLAHALVESVCESLVAG